MNRLIQELQLHMRLRYFIHLNKTLFYQTKLFDILNKPQFSDLPCSISGGKEAVNLNYLEPVLNAVIHPLVDEGSQGVSRTLQAMQDYNITRDDLESLLELNRWPGRPDPMARVDSKVNIVKLFLIALN